MKGRPVESTAIEEYVPTDAVISGVSKLHKVAACVTIAKDKGNATKSNITIIKPL